MKGDCVGFLRGPFDGQKDFAVFLDQNGGFFVGYFGKIDVR